MAAALLVLLFSLFFQISLRFRDCSYLLDRSYSGLRFTLSWSQIRKQTWKDKEFFCFDVKQFFVLNSDMWPTWGVTHKLHSAYDICPLFPPSSGTVPLLKCSARVYSRVQFVATLSSEQTQQRVNKVSIRTELQWLLDQWSMTVCNTDLLHTWTTIKTTHKGHAGSSLGVKRHIQSS